MANHPSISSFFHGVSKLSAVTAGCCLAISSAALADTSAYENQITTVDERIQVTRDSIRSKESEKASLQRLLENYNKQIAAVKKQRSLLKKKIAKLQKAKAGESARGDSLRQQVERHGDELGKQLSSLYQSGRSPHLRTLLSLDDPSAGSRLLRYYQHVTQHRLTDIEEARANLTQVMRNVTRAGEQESRVQQERDALKSREKELAKLSQKRTALLAKIEGNLSEEQKRLSALEDDRVKLQALVDDLRRQEEAAAANQTDKGTMPWPLVGEIAAQYGQSKAQGTAEWAGILIKAPKGSPVVAIHEGQVVYAEWLRGFGLLIIVDHGNGMMSLYGNNDELMYVVGETVLPGDVIATVGDSSSLNETGLYFELRQDGSPVDPVGILSERVAAATR
ncbi:MAG: murein hydrolase activator EnvC family protein [Granulosicoccaceae bacterium]